MKTSLKYLPINKQTELTEIVELIKEILSQLYNQVEELTALNKFMVIPPNCRHRYLNNLWRRPIIQQAIITSEPTHAHLLSLLWRTCPILFPC